MLIFQGLAITKFRISISIDSLAANQHLSIRRKETPIYPNKLPLDQAAMWVNRNRDKFLRNRRKDRYRRINFSPKS